MTDHEPDLHESPLSPAEEERIRRLLAEARHTDPIPEAVALRLEDALAAVSAERASRGARGNREDQRAPVVDLAARRRRTATNLLVAAAAVLAVGFGITQVLPGGMGGTADNEAATTADGVAPADSAGSGGDSRNVSPESAPEAPSGSSDAPTEADGGAAGEAFRIRSEEFGSDVRQARRQLGVDDTDGQLEYVAADCLPADVGAGDVVAATYDGAPAAIVLRTPSGDVQVVDLYLCGDTVPRRSITLTAP